MKKVIIKEFINSNTAISYDDGIRCKEEILKYIEEDVVVLDFQGVEFAITAFLNPVIGDLILEKGKSIMAKIQIENCSNDIIQKIMIVKNGALMKRDNKN